MNDSIERLESRVRSYSRSFPAVFTRAEGATLHSDDGRRFIDLFAGAGALNYGHNPEALRERLLEYLGQGGITHGLDMATGAKVRFLEAFERRILGPRGLSYRVMFPGPTGTNAVEAALKLARKVTGRARVIAFTHGFHGMTLGALALTGSAAKRRGAGLPLEGVTHMPFDGFLGEGIDTIDVIEAYLSSPSSGVEAPAAFVVETVQGEGGIQVARTSWLQRLARLARRWGSLLIMDDIQMGCGRTGPFFSFEEAGIRPDVVCLSKSISGFGLPMALTLIHPDLDAFSPGEHNGTFRGNNLAFVTGAAALERYWADDRLQTRVAVRSPEVKARLSAIAGAHGGQVRGRGFVFGLAFDDPAIAPAASRAAFERGVIVETAGARGEVLKFMAPLTISDGELQEGLGRLEAAVADVCARVGEGALARPRSAPPTAPAEVQL